MSSNKPDFLRSLGACVSGLAIVLGASGARAQDATSGYDTIIRGGTIVDGSGLTAYRGDVALKGGHIAAVGDLASIQAGTTIDATGLIVAPGFINIHSHARPEAAATAVNMLTQGVTTEITNADGHGTTNITKQFAEFAANGLAENIGLYIGFNAAWTEIMGAEDRRAAPGDIARMQSILDNNLAQGAWGVAAGLDYKPAYFAEADEVIKVVSAVKKWRTNFPNHDRLRPEEQYSSYKGMVETISIGEKAGLVPVITHMKSQGREQGNAGAVIALMDRATARGTFTAADLYPYLAGHSGLTLLVPGWAHVGGREAMLKRFADPATRARIVADAESAMTLRFGGPSGVRLLKTGQELTDIIKEMQVRPGEAVVRLLEKEESSTILRFGREDDLIAFLQYRNSAMACDCGATTEQRVHPRNWGSFPRVLGHYVRETGALTIEDAIRKMTALPAAIIGMSNRGYLAPGMSADLVLFDPAKVIDHATYEEPIKPSEGIRHVFVNGQIALRDGQPTGAKGGKTLLRGAHMPSRPMMGREVRKASALGSVSNRSANVDVSLALTQGGGDRFASGHLQILDRGTGIVWVADRLGVLQTTAGWASVTASLRDRLGNLRAVTVTLDHAEGSAVAGKPILVVSLDGQADLAGSPEGRLRVVTN